jgi:hypothetical protein
MWGIYLPETQSLKIVYPKYGVVSAKGYLLTFLAGCHAAWGYLSASMPQ